VEQALSNGVGALVCGTAVQSLRIFFDVSHRFRIAAFGLVATVANRARLK
jgi:hypothetical protein